MTSALPPALRADIDRAGYYPLIVADVVDTALAGQEVLAHLVHPETTFDEGDEVRRHVTVLVLTADRLLIAHADDHTEPPDRPGPTALAREGVAARLGPTDRTYAIATSEAIPLHQVSAVVLTHVVDRPERYRPGGGPREMTLGVAWGVASRIDIEPAACEDPDCEADHGYTGSLTGDDLSLRVSADAEGQDAVEAVVRFARALSAATSR